MPDECAQDETIDTSTGEVQRREVPIGTIAPEPDNLHIPVPYPFPGNDPAGTTEPVDVVQQSDVHQDVPDPDGDNCALAAAHRQRGLEGLTYNQLIQVGISRDEATRMVGAPQRSEQHSPGAVTSDDHQRGPAAGAPMDTSADGFSYHPPSDDEVWTATQSAISGPMSPLHTMYAQCRACSLCETRRQVVLGSGNPAPELAFVGQAPGPAEDEQGGAFIGPAGQELTAVLNSVEINRVTHCYLLNTVCCRPLDPVTGRVCPPSVQEMAACRSRLTEQLKILIAGGNLKVIVLLGKEAYVDFFYKTEVEQGTFNLKSFRVGPRLGWQDMRRRHVPATFPKVYFTYHPSYILRNGGTSAPDYPAWQKDFMAIKRWCSDGLFTKPRGPEILA